MDRRRTDAQFVYSCSLFYNGGVHYTIRVEYSER